MNRFCLDFVDVPTNMKNKKPRTKDNRIDGRITSNCQHYFVRRRWRPTRGRASVSETTMERSWHGYWHFTCFRYRVVPLERLGLHAEARHHDDQAQRLAAQHVKRRHSTRYNTTYPASVHSLPGFDPQTTIPSKTFNKRFSRNWTEATNLWYSYTLFDSKFTVV